MPSMARPSDEFGKDHGLLHEVVVTGRKVGAGAEFWAKIAHDEALFGKVVAFVARDGFEATTSQRRACEIMGKNFLGVEEVMTHFGVRPTPAQLRQLAAISFPESVLLACKDTHLLVAGFPMTILDVRTKAPKDPKTFYSYDDARYNTQKFATKEGVEVRWHLIRKTPVANSTSQTFADQQVLLAQEDEVPKACVVVYGVVLYYLVTRERLFSGVYVRCIDVGSDGDRVGVGLFDSDGLHVNDYSDDYCVGNVGVASARKSK